jgi:hypothetical protein
MRAEEFDQKFDDGEDVTGDLDLAAIPRPALEQRRTAGADTFGLGMWYWNAPDPPRSPDPPR